MDNFKSNLILLTLIILMMMYSFPCSMSYFQETPEVSSNCNERSGDCVCNIKIAIDEITRLIIKSNRKGFELEEQIRNFVCTSFKKLPSSILIETSGMTSMNLFDVRRFYDTRRRVLAKKRVKRQIQLGTPTNNVFENAIAHILPGDQCQYVILGTSATFLCSGGDSDMEETVFFPKKFNWTHYDGTPITAPQSSIDSKLGVLSFKSVQLTDIGIYNCTLEVETDDTDVGTQINQYMHQLIVVSEPIFWLKIHTAYITKSCTKDEAELIRYHLVSWISTIICSMCTVHNISVGCSKYPRGFHQDATEHGAFGQEYHRYEIKFAISVIGLELKVQGMLSSCPISCLEAIHLTIVKILRNSLDKLSNLPIEISYEGMGRIVHDAVPSAFVLHLITGCLGGFFNEHKLCFPCLSGSYSPEDNSECFLCDIGFYQENLGQTYCKPCSSGLSTMNKGSISPHQCAYPSELLLKTNLMKPWVLVLTILLGLILLVILILIGVRFCCPGTSCGIFVSRVCCCCCPIYDHSNVDDTNIVYYTELKNQEDNIQNDSEATKHRRGSDEQQKHNSSKRRSRSIDQRKFHEISSDSESMFDNGSNNKNQKRFGKNINSKTAVQFRNKTSIIPARRNQTNENINSISSKIQMENGDKQETNKNDIDCINSGGKISIDETSRHDGHGFHRCVKPNSTKSIQQSASSKFKILTPSAPVIPIPPPMPP